MSLESNWIETCKRVEQIISTYSLARMDCLFLDALSTSSPLLQFIKETDQQSIMALVNAVEDLGENFIRQETVADLIEASKLIRPIISQEYRSIQDFCNRLSNIVVDLKLVVKVESSNHSINGLKNLLDSIANRGELTKETIYNATQSGYFRVSLENVTAYILSLLYNGNDDQVKQVSIADIQDLRSGALLIINSRKDQSLERNFHDMEMFIEYCDLAFDYLTKINNLKALGNNKDYCSEKIDFDALPDNIQEIETETQNWQTILDNYLGKHFFLNFFAPERFWVLERYFSGNGTVDDVYPLLNFIHPISKNEIKLIQFQQQEQLLDMEHRLERLGKILDKIFHNKVKSDANVSSYFRNTFVVLSVENKELISTILKIFTNSLPKPSTVLFCEYGTTWQPLNAIVSRSFFNNLSGDLYCIAQIEKLSFSLQAQLVDKINRLKELNLEKKSSLCLIDTSGNQTSYVVNQFKRFLQNIPNTTTTKAIQPFSKAYLYSSDVSGVGKTENIRLEALRRRKKLVHLPIMDSVNRAELCNRLKRLNLSHIDCLHIDIRNLSQSNACLLNNLLFEIITFGMVIDDRVMFKIPVNNLDIFIELESQSRFWNFLTIRETYLINKKDIEFRLENLVFNKSLLSRSQVTFNYLKALDNDTIDTEDIIFSGPNANATVVSDEECRLLIQKYFFKNKKEINYSLMHVFINVLAEQFIKFSQSVFLKTQQITHVTESQKIRSKLVKVLMDVYSEFSTRSVHGNRKQQQHHVMGSKSDVVLFKESGMVRWEESNHLIVAFHKYDSTITALYRDLSFLQQTHSDIFDTLQSQKVSLPDYSSLNQEALLFELGKMAGSITEYDGQYAMTADNLLKMMLILLRVEACIPVVISGETGCGKTSLVEFLAKKTGASFNLLNFHAGTTPDIIISFMEAVIEQAYNNPNTKHLVFLDEINTCDYLGLVSEIVTLKSIRGISLPINISVIAACNPYRTRKHIYTSALEKDKASDLAYRVNPLPDCLIDYIWDYGFLSQTDEMSYIQTMLGRLTIQFPKHILCTIICESQAFVRDLEDASSVSLRDVNRFIVLCQYFLETLKKRSEPLKKANQIMWIQENQRDDKYDISSVVLALSVCYYSRLAKLEYRENYLTTVCKHLPRISKEDFVRIVDEEQTSYLRRMEIPPNIAWNRSLKENIFVILVCILNKLPVFVVGKPGCSKSLAIQLLTSNLRGEDSIDKYFKTLPQLIFIAFQGSESSTSEGILKVFDKARGYLKINEKEEKVIPVVILDEIGLAEISAHNPLKALHALLEPKKRDVAVVGISNWRLDAAKMNRAVHVSRPEADENELKEIAKTILFENNHIEKTDTIELLLDYLSKSYYEFISNKKYNNFHGLRDYYSLVKSVIIEEEENFAVSLCRAIDRNFGGLSASAMNFKKILFEKASITESVPSDLPILELIKENIEDKNARHLMLITNSDSALDIITYYYKEFLNRSPEIIYGSQFNLDKTEEYSYVVLNKIIYCMEEGYTLILKDLDSVYGSLYDMLNQNYTYVAKRRNCRIAIGPHSNPMCHVNENFRCIVLVDQKRLATCDPPFLNRFEKQILNFENISESKVNECVMRLNEWVENITNLDSNVFTVNDMFPSYSSDTLSSLVLANTNSTTSVEHCVEICKEALIATSTFDGIVRLAYSSVSKEECDNWLNRYQLDKHNNLLDYYNNCDGFAHMIMTFSHILTELNFTWLSSIRVREFNTEREFAKKVEDFFNDEENGLLTIHFESHLDGKFVPMVKFIVDHHIQNSDRTDKKVFLILHISRDIYENANEDWKLNFMNGWKQVTIDELSPNFDQTNLLDIHDMFSSEFYNVESILKDIIQATLMKIDYFAVNIEYISTLSSKIIEDAEFLQFIGEILNEELQKVQFDWRKHVALDKKKLAESGCLIDAIKNEMQDLVQRKLLNILKFIEQHSALETFFIADPKLRALWKNITAKYHNNGANNSKIMLIKGLRLPYSKWQCEIYKELKDKLEMLKQNSSIEKGDNQEQQLEPLLLSLIESSECVFGLQDYSEELLKRDFLTITAQELGLNSEFAQIFENIILGLFEINLVLSPKERLILMVWNNQKTLLAVVELIKYCCGNSIEIPEDIECLDDLLDIITLSLLQDGTRTPNNEWKDKIATVLPILLEENVSATLLKILKDFSHYLLEYPYEIQQICTEILCYDCNLEDPKLIENILQILSKSQNLFQSKMVFISRLELTEELLEVVCRELVEIQDVKYLTQIVYKICVDHIEELEEGNFENLRVLNNLLVNNPYCPLYYVFIDVLEELVSDQELTNEEELRILGNKINSPNSESVPDIERAYYVASIRHHLKNISSQEDLQTTISGSIISNYLSQDEDAKNYLLKCVKQSFDNWLDFKEFVESDISGSLDVDLTNKSFDTLGYNIFRSLPRYKEAEKAFDEMYYLNNTRDMLELIQEAKSNPKLLYTLMGLITNNIHFSQITDSTLRLCVEFFASSFQSFSKSVKNLVTRLLRSATVRDCSYVIRISVMCLAVCIPENPISIFIKNPNTVRSTYVVTAEHDILGGILKAINTKDGGHSRYRCNCGYVYLIGNCGQPNGTARCPTCGATLGGEGHKLIQGSRIDEAKRDGTDSSNEKGCTMSAINDDYHTVRQFPPAMFRVWQFFINSIILNGLDINLVSIDEIRGFFIQNQLNNPIDYFNEKAAKDWNILAQILDQQGENLCFLLQQCIISNLDYLFGNNERLDTEDKRAIFENGLIEYTSRVLGDINLSIRDIKMNSTRSEENSSLQAIIEETCTPNNSQINKFTEFRITSSPSVQGMKALFMSNPENAQLYPFLKAYLTNEKELHHIESLFDLITFSNLLMDKCDNTIERATAEKTEMKYYAETNGLKELYGKVVTEWKAEKAVNYGCKQPKSKKKIDTEMLSFFLIEDQQEPFGLYICAALQGYAEVQNNFIDIAEQNAEKSANLAFLKSINGIIGLPTIPVQKAQKKDLVIINPEYLEDLTITFSYKNYEYGKGTTVGYLFDKIEFALASKYLLGKKRLDFENLRKIKYIGESFGSNADMAARKKIPNPIPLDDSERTKVNILINDLPRLKKIQGSLQKLLEVMNLVNFNPDVTVSTFCYDWKINLNDKEQFFANFTLNKIVNLFEYVEEVIFDFEVNYLSDLYTIELEENIVQRIIRSCQENNVNINNLTTVLKRFIIRFLIPAFYQQTNIGLNFYIIMDSLWPITSQNEIVAIEDGDIIPDSVCLCHTKSLCISLIKHLAEQDRKVREAESFVKLEEYSAQPTLSFKKVEDKKKKPAQAGRRLKINA
ncbi:Hypothetical protein NAEGRDRAFT_80150 [Naegleria gruberi]|uniref:RZ-type domain-containing protein n=1 Tax=Naegleria gruberi TaxID=5762 RepID=D2VJ31_NAEGR|nr:uncharacterized protein NAEGRDRAFT_80150 [Naegleria gruberi]EFC43205.1 Hypothetical protein NAEGRDRAFT_80150 [Naegleria gruberi]|eukprot:XP_002675949.1 Hypothetical protein NAEGRDRAFT_80150 [Naegleria gruberi strain NEG-M]